MSVHLIARLRGASQDCCDFSKQCHELCSPLNPREHTGSSSGCPALGWVALHPHVLQGAWTCHSTSFRQQTECPASLAVLPLKWWVKSVGSFDRLDFLRALKPKSVFSLLLSPSTLLPSLKESYPFSSSLLFVFASAFISNNVQYVLSSLLAQQ